MTYKILVTDICIATTNTKEVAFDAAIGILAGRVSRCKDYNESAVIEDISGVRIGGVDIEDVVDLVKTWLI